MVHHARNVVEGARLRGRYGPARPSCTSYAEIYRRIYHRFQQTQRVTGSAGLTLIASDQDGHHTRDPGVPEVLFRLMNNGALKCSDVDLGDGRMTLSGRPGSLYVGPANTDADWRADGRHSLVLMAVPTTRLQTMLGHPSAGGGDPLRALYGREVYNPTLASLVEGIWRESARGGTASSLLIDGMFSTLVGTLVRLGGEPPSEEPSRFEVAALEPTRLARVTEYIDANLAGAMTVEALAGVACLSPFHFSRSFKTATGLTPHAYVVARRVDAAKRMLTTSDATLTDVAFTCGFASQSHFGQVFKAHVGATPRAFRLDTKIG